MTISDIFTRWQKSDHIQLHAGEMTAQELRSVKAIVKAIEAEVTATIGDRVVVPGWQDISTAPKDGTAISAWHKVWNCPVSVRYVVSNAPCKWVEVTLTTQWPDEAFTHWQPLPAPPSPVGENRGSNV